MAHSQSPRAVWAIRRLHCIDANSVWIKRALAIKSVNKATTPQRRVPLRNDRQDMTPITPTPSRKTRLLAAAAFAIATLAVAGPAMAQYHQEIRNDPRRCTAGAGPAVMITVDGIKSSTGKMRVQSYRAMASDWLQKGRWLTRTEVPARAGTMTFCVPVPAPGQYAIAIRHDVNGSGSTDIRVDGGGMSNNPSINIFNLGKPSYTKTAFPVGDGVKSIRIQMKYL